MATHSSILTWEIPWTEESGGLQSMGREDPLKNEMATHFNTLVWEIPWTEESGGLPTLGMQESDTTKPPPPQLILLR